MMCVNNQGIEQAAHLHKNIGNIVFLVYTLAILVYSSPRKTNCFLVFFSHLKKKCLGDDVPNVFIHLCLAYQI